MGRSHNTRELFRPTAWLRGIGLHTGGVCGVTVAPASPGAGVWLTRRDLVPPSRLRADLSNVTLTRRRVVVGRGTEQISTIEHLLAALAGLGIFDAEVCLSGPEVPALDGSARPYADQLFDCSRPSERQTARPWRVVRPARGQDAAGGQCLLLPGQGTQISCSIEFSHPRVGKQTLCFRLGEPRSFLDRLAPARTFGFLQEATCLRAAGLARGANLGRALVFDEQDVVNSAGTRFADEPVRHKVLDALGDLALLGGPLQGQVRLRRCSHRLLLDTLKRVVRCGALRR